MNAVRMLIVSLTKSATDATYSPGALQPWVSELEAMVARDGKFAKWQVGYLSVSPPPFFWDYKCKKCRFWTSGPMGPCSMVSGNIAPWGWCVIWLPPDDYDPFTWPKELLAGDW